MTRHSRSVMLTDDQIARLERRRLLLGLTPHALLQRFDEKLRADGCIHTPGAAKMRLDRVLNPAMRRPVTEATKLALAAALDWSGPQMEKALQVRSAALGNGVPPMRSARQIALEAVAQIETHQIARGVNLKVDNLRNVYAAAYRLFQRLRQLMTELSAEEFARSKQAQAIYRELDRALNKSLRPHLTKWRDRYEHWRETEAPRRRLTEQALQQLFPEHRQLAKDLERVSLSLQRNARRLKLLVLKR